MRTASLAVCIFLLLVSVAEARFVRDDAGIIEDAEAIERVTGVFYDRTGIGIGVNTHNDVDDISTYSANVFNELGLDRLERSELSLVVVYSYSSNGTKDRMHIGYASRCGLPKERIEKALYSTLEKWERYRMFTDFFIDVVHALENEITDFINSGASCEVSLKPACEPIKQESRSGAYLAFNADAGIYKPRSPENPHGRGLDSDLNPYNDGIVAYGDPLSCQLVNVRSDEAVISVSGSKGTRISANVPCNNGLCTLCISPEHVHRGEVLTCTALTPDGSFGPVSLTVAKHIFVFYPAGSDIEDMYDSAERNFNTLIDISQLNRGNAEYSVKPVYLRDGTDRTINDIRGLLDATAFVMTRYYTGDIEYDKFIALAHDQRKENGFTEWGSPAIYIDPLSSDFNLAHELGHSMNYLCDEYNWELWILQNEEIEDMGREGCPNPIPDECKNVFRRNYEGEPVPYCRGMPYRSPAMPLPSDASALLEVPPSASYYSVMGMWNRNLIYPVESKYPLRS